MKQNRSFFQNKESSNDASLKGVSQRCKYCLTTFALITINWFIIHRVARKTGFLNLSSLSIQSLPDYVFGYEYVCFLIDL